MHKQSLNEEMPSNNIEVLLELSLLFSLLKDPRRILLAKGYDAWERKKPFYAEAKSSVFINFG